MNDLHISEVYRQHNLEHTDPWTSEHFTIFSNYSTLLK